MNSRSIFIGLGSESDLERDSWLIEERYEQKDISISITDYLCMQPNPTNQLIVVIEEVYYLSLSLSLSLCLSTAN